MMNVMHILQLKGVGGVQELVHNLVNGLAKNNITNFIFTFKGAEEIYIRQYMSENIPVFVSPYSVNDIRNIKLLYNQIKKENITKIHVHNTVPQIYCSILLRFLSVEVSGYVTEHSLSSKRRKYKVFRLLDEFSYKPYKKIISVSDSVDNVLKKWLKHLSSDKFEVVSNGIELSRFKNAKAIDRKLLCFNDDDFVIISIGRLRPGKGFLTIINAIALLPEKYKLIIVGDGPQRGELETLIEKLGLRNRVVLTGNRSNVEEYLKSSNLYVSASHTEGFGLTIIEATAAGLGVIGSDIPAFRELLPSTQLFKIDDYAELAYIIKYRQPCCAENILHNYSLENMAIQYIKVYKL